MRRLQSCVCMLPSTRACFRPHAHAFIHSPCKLPGTEAKLPVQLLSRVSWILEGLAVQVSLTLVYFLLKPGSVPGAQEDTSPSAHYTGQQNNRDRRWMN